MAGYTDRHGRAEITMHPAIARGLAAWRRGDGAGDTPDPDTPPPRGAAEPVLGEEAESR